MSVPTSFEKELGKKIRANFGDNTKVVRFADDSEEDFVFIVSGTDCPVQGVTSYATVGNYRNIQKVGQADLMVELVAACATVTPHFDNLVASCVFDGVKNRSKIVYGSCIRNILDQYQISSTLNHITFVAPFLWESLSEIAVDKSLIHCLTMLPISEEEANYLEEKGIDALEARFDEKQIDIFNINRQSVI